MRKNSNTLSAQQLDDRYPDNPFYVNEHLAPERKKLFGLARGKQKRSNIKYLWTRDGNIFMRKTDQGAVTKITKKEDLDTL